MAGWISTRAGSGTELITAVGAAGVALIVAAFPRQDGEAIKAPETALRWMVRGLAAQQAYAAYR